MCNNIRGLHGNIKDLYTGIIKGLHVIFCSETLVTNRRHLLNYLYRILVNLNYCYSIHMRELVGWLYIFVLDFLHRLFLILDVTRVLYLDFSSAFDLVNHEALLNNLTLTSVGGPVFKVLKKHSNQSTSTWVC